MILFYLFFISQRGLAAFFRFVSVALSPFSNRGFSATVHSLGTRGCLPQFKNEFGIEGCTAHSSIIVVFMGGSCG